MTERYVPAHILPAAITRDQFHLALKVMDLVMTEGTEREMNDHELHEVLLASLAMFRHARLGH